MIELDLSYEESKKILELGYDFGRKFGDIYKKRDCPYKYILVNYEKIKAQDYLYQIEEEYYDTHVERFTLEMQSIDYEESIFDDLKLHEHFKLGEIFNDSNSKGFVPIIPKAALLMALPSFERGIVSKDHEHLSFEIGSDFRFAYLKETHSGKTVKNFSSDDENPALIKAFLWVHENYPEELKKKFDEVMG
jgi:hypothetical protein